MAAGSTWHAAGGMHTFNGEANISRLQKYTIDLYREIEALSGGRSLAAGHVPGAIARDGERFEIDILGEMRAAIVRLEPMYDPEGSRLRG